MKYIKLTPIYICWLILLPIVYFFSGMHYIVQFFGSAVTVPLDYLEEKARKINRGR